MCNFKSFSNNSYEGTFNYSVQGGGGSIKMQMYATGAKTGGMGWGSYPCECSHNFFLIEYKVYELKSREHLYCLQFTVFVRGG